MKAYFQDSKGAVQYAEDLLLTSKVGSPLIMIMSREKLGVCSVSDVTDSVLAETALELTQNIFEEWLSISQESTPDG